MVHTAMTGQTEEKAGRAQGSHQLAVVSHDVILHPRGRLELLPAVLTGERLLPKNRGEPSHTCHSLTNQHMLLKTNCWVLTSLQFSMCFFSPSTVFLLTLLHLGQGTLPLATIWRCQRSSWLPGGRQQRQERKKLDSYTVEKPCDIPDMW